MFRRFSSDRTKEIDPGEGEQIQLSKSGAMMEYRTQQLHHRHQSQRSPMRPSLNGQTSSLSSHQQHQTLAQAQTQTPPKRANILAGSPSKQPKTKRWSNSTRLFVFILVTAFLFVMVQELQFLSYHPNGFPAEPLPAATILESTSTKRGRMYVAREQLEIRRLEAHQQAQNAHQSKQAQRKQRTRPNQPIRPQVYEIHTSDLQQRPKRRIPKIQRPTGMLPANIDDICGQHAKQAASNSNPENPTFIARDALNSRSRVLITGILNPIGFHLALALKELCGVEVIAGIDPMFPNTLINRMDLQKRIEILTTAIPKFVHPVVMPFVGLDPKPSKSKKEKPLETIEETGETSLINFKPTHIIHLATYSAEEHQDQLNFDYRNAQSPYTGSESQMFTLRSSQVSMEQILATLASTGEGDEQPHVVYASARTKSSKGKLIDEVLVDTYHALHGIFAVGVRLPDTTYGPWGRHASAIRTLAESAIGQWGKRKETVDLMRNLTDYEGDFVYVADVVGGLIAAMQFRNADWRPQVFDFGSMTSVWLSTLSEMVANLMDPKHSSEARADITTSTYKLATDTRRILQWQPSTNLRVGLSKMLGWHLDQAFPYGASKVETGDEFRRRVGVEICGPDDILCHLGKNYVPCISECSTKQECRPSVFDNVQKLVQEITQDCDVVLYTQSLGYNVKDLKLKATYKEDGKVVVCNFAFIPETSRLASAAIEKVPRKELKGFGIQLSKDEQNDPVKSKIKKTKGLNGRLLYKGWILVWVPNAEDGLTIEDQHLLKMSPGKLFHRDVKHALFVEESFPVSPNTDDVLFLIGQSHRKKLPERSAWRKLEDGKKAKYRLSAEPERRAAIILSPLKHTKETENGEPAKLKVLEATKYMIVELGDDPDEPEDSGVKKQREFYERIPTFVNRVDFKSNNEPWYRYDLKHWVRSRWVVHDMKLEEARQIRCDWYQEHIQWGTSLDQLTFAHVMAVRELERRVAHEEPDDHVKPAHEMNSILMQLSDAHEWIALDSEENRLAHVHPMDAFSTVPQHIAAGISDNKDQLVHNLELPRFSEKKKTPLFVRIISEPVMMLARRAWAQQHGGLPGFKPKRKKKRKKKKKH